MKLDPHKVYDAPVSDVVATMEDATTDFGEKIHKKVTAKNSKIPVNLLFTKTTKDQVIFTGEYMEVYIRDSDVGRNTKINGTQVETLGLFTMRMWDKAATGKDPLHPAYETRYMIPAFITLCPSAITRRSMSLHGEPEEKYLVLGFEKNAPFLKSTVIIKSPKALSAFVDTILKNMFDSNVVQYEDLLPLILESCRLNSIDLNANISSLEMIFAAQARDAEDMSIPYRATANKKGPNKGSMKFIKLTQIPHITSTFTSFAFQDIDYAITTSAKRHRNKETDKESAIEQIMKY